MEEYGSSLEGWEFSGMGWTAEESTSWYADLRWGGRASGGASWRASAIGSIDMEGESDTLGSRVVEDRNSESSCRCDEGKSFAQCIRTLAHSRRRDRIKSFVTSHSHNPH